MRLSRLLLLSLALLLPAFGLAGSGPLPPCGMTPEPPYPGLGMAPIVALWRHGSLAPNWMPPACAGWASAQFSVLMALSASFRFHGSGDDLLAGFGAVSALNGIRYWSVTDGRWRRLITKASALTGRDARQERPDFTAAELRQGDDLYYTQSDSRSSAPVTYRLQVREAGPDRVVVEVENVSSVRLLLYPIYGPGGLRTTYFLTRIAGDLWGYYDFSAVHDNLFGFGAGHEASYINRAAALYRHIAGIPTDREPPLAP